MAETTLEKEIEWEKEIKILKDELVAQEAMKEEEKQLRKPTEDGKRRMEEELHRMQSNMDWLKEERTVLQQEKDKLWRMAETEIEILKEELWQ